MKSVITLTALFIAYFFSKAGFAFGQNSGQNFDVYKSRERDTVLFYIDPSQLAQREIALLFESLTQLTQDHEAFYNVKVNQNDNLFKIIGEQYNFYDKKNYYPSKALAEVIAEKNDIENSKLLVGQSLILPLLPVNPASYGTSSLSQFLDPYRNTIQVSSTEALSTWFVRSKALQVVLKDSNDDSTHLQLPSGLKTVGLLGNAKFLLVSNLFGWSLSSNPFENLHFQETGLARFSVTLNKIGEVLDVKALEKDLSDNTAKEIAETIYKIGFENLSIEKADSDTSTGELMVLLNDSLKIVSALAGIINTPPVLSSDKFKMAGLWACKLSSDDFLDLKHSLGPALFNKWYGESLISVGEEQFLEAFFPSVQRDSSPVDYVKIDSAVISSVAYPSR